MNTMSTDIKPKIAPLAVGDLVRVIAATYYHVKVGTVARVARVRTHRREPPLYELERYPEYLFWARELVLAEQRGNGAKGQPKP